MEDSVEEIDSVIDGFDVVQNVLNEIYLASLAKRGQTEAYAKQLLNQKEKEELRKKQIQRRAEREQEEIENINIQIAEKIRLFDEAQANLTREEKDNSLRKFGK